MDNYNIFPVISIMYTYQMVYIQCSIIENNLHRIVHMWIACFTLTTFTYYLLSFSTKNICEGRQSILPSIKFNLIPRLLERTFYVSIYFQIKFRKICVPTSSSRDKVQLFLALATFMLVFVRFITLDSLFQNQTKKIFIPW